MKVCAFEYLKIVIFLIAIIIVIGVLLLIPYILNGNEQLINSQLTSMMGLTRASPDFKPLLLKIVMLVHCYLHNAGRPKKRRLKA